MLLNFKNFIAIFMSWISTNIKCRVRVMVFNATYNNISVILWRSVLLMEETRGPEENHGPVTSH
jgi:hypothetical protein